MFAKIKQSKASVKRLVTGTLVLVLGITSVTGLAAPAKTEAYGNTYSVYDCAYLKRPTVSIWHAPHKCTKPLQFFYRHFKGYPIKNIDGDFGKETAMFTITYQRNRGIKDDSIVGPKTWDEVYLECADADAKDYEFKTLVCYAQM